MDNSFSKSIRLLRAQEYRRAYSNGQVIKGRHIQLHYVANTLQANRFGISVGRKIGKAVQRNRLRRRLREAIRLRRMPLTYGVDVIIHPRSSASRLKSKAIFSEVHRLLEHLTQTIGILQERGAQLHLFLQTACFVASASSLSVLAILLGIFLSSHQ